VSQIERFRRERIRKLYGMEERCTAVYRSDARRDPTDTHDKREQQQQIRRLEQQLRQRDRMIMELQKADINKEKHLVTLTSHNMTLTSTL
jgi:septal ring factor EnvC (AmiA/AmiB activator)